MASTLIRKKSVFLVHSGVMLGYVVCLQGKLPDPRKIAVIVNMPCPTTQKDVQRLFGVAQFNRCFIRDFTTHTYSINRLLHFGLAKANLLDQWTRECQQAFELMKHAYSNAPILITPTWTLEFHVHTDACDLGLGAMLAQNPTGKTDQPILYASRLLTSGGEKLHHHLEREALAMVYANKKFRHYLLANHFVFIVDHQALLYLVNRPLITGRIARWLLLFQEFDFEVLYKCGKHNVIADHLSCLPTGEPATGIPDQTPDAQLFTVHVGWMDPILEYLRTGVTPRHLSQDQR